MPRIHPSRLRDPRRNPDPRTQELIRQLNAGDSTVLPDVVAAFMRAGEPIPYGVAAPYIEGGRAWVLAITTEGENSGAFVFLSQHDAQRARWWSLMEDLNELGDRWGKQSQDYQDLWLALEESDWPAAEEILQDTLERTYAIYQVPVYPNYDAAPFGPIPPMPPRTNPGDDRLRELARRVEAGDEEAKLPLAYEGARRGVPVVFASHDQVLVVVGLMPVKVYGGGLQVNLGRFFYAHWTWDHYSNPEKLIASPEWHYAGLGKDAADAAEAAVRARAGGPPYTPNPGGDERLRRLERAAAAGDPEAQAQLREERIRREPIHGIRFVGRGGIWQAHQSRILIAEGQPEGRVTRLRAPHYSVTTTTALKELQIAKGGVYLIDQAQDWNTKTLEAVGRVLEGPLSRQVFVVITVPKLSDLEKLPEWTHQLEIRVGEEEAWRNPGGDERLRRLERAAATGDPEAKAALAAVSTRRGLCADCGSAFTEEPGSFFAGWVTDQRTGLRICYTCAARRDLVAMKRHDFRDGMRELGYIHPLYQGYAVSRQVVTSLPGFPMIWGSADRHADTGWQGAAQATWRGFDRWGRRWHGRGAPGGPTRGKLYKHRDLPLSPENVEIVTAGRDAIRAADMSLEGRERLWHVRRLRDAQDDWLKARDMPPLPASFNPPGDERLRELQRQAAGGDEEASRAYAMELMRRGEPIPLPAAWPLIKKPVDVWVANNESSTLFSDGLDAYAFLSQAGVDAWQAEYEGDRFSVERTTLRPNPGRKRRANPEDYRDLARRFDSLEPEEKERLTQLMLRSGIPQSAVQDLIWAGPAGIREVPEQDVFNLLLTIMRSHGMTSRDAITHFLQASEPTRRRGGHFPEHYLVTRCPRGHRFDGVDDFPNLADECVVARVSGAEGEEPSSAQFHLADFYVDPWADGRIADVGGPGTLWLCPRCSATWPFMGGIEIA